MLGALIAHRADQPCAAGAGERKDAEEVRLIQIDVQLAIHRRPGAFDVGDIKHLAVRTAREAGAERVAHDRARTIAAGEVRRLAISSLFSAVRSCACTLSPHQ